MERRSSGHTSALAGRTAGYQPEAYRDHQPGDRVMTCDGFPGRVTAVLDGPYPGYEEYQVELDGGLGGGSYVAGQLQHMGSTPVQASEHHTADLDYPELGTILTDRPDPATHPDHPIRHHAHYKPDDPRDREDPESHNHGWCHVCKEHHASEEEAEGHDQASTDWRQAYKQLPPRMHRGFALQLPAGVHDHVHDESASPADRAEHLEKYLRNYYRESGTHWTPDQEQAEHYADVSSYHQKGGSYSVTDPPLTHVIMHAAKPRLRDIERDPDILNETGVIGHDYHEDSEIPLQSGAPVSLRGVSWKKDGDPDFTSHSFRGARQHIATTINGQQVDEHGDSPSEIRATDPNSYDSEATEGDPDPRRDRPLTPADLKGYESAPGAPPARTAATREETGNSWHEFRGRYQPDAMHRGIHVRLPEHVHDIVHDQSLPLADRAEVLSDHFSRQGLGMHWTPHIDIAHRAIGNASDRASGGGAWDDDDDPEYNIDDYMEDYGHGGDDESEEPEHTPTHTDVMFHIRRPGERNRIRDPRTLEEHGIGWTHSPDEHEMPLKPGSPAHLTGISWRPHEPEYPNEPFEHHDFEKPVRHEARFITRDEAIQAWLDSPEARAGMTAEEVLRRQATTINGEQIDGHGDAPDEVRAIDPNAYDDRSTEGGGDDHTTEPLHKKDTPRYDGASIMSGAAEGTSGAPAAGGVPPAFATARVPWTPHERALLEQSGSFIPEEELTKEAREMTPEELTERFGPKANPKPGIMNPGHGGRPAKDPLSAVTDSDELVSEDVRDVERDNWPIYHLNSLNWQVQASLMSAEAAGIPFYPEQGPGTVRAHIERHHGAAPADVPDDELHYVHMDMHDPASEAFDSPAHTHHAEAEAAAMSPSLSPAAGGIHWPTYNDIPDPERQPGHLQSSDFRPLPNYIHLSSIQAEAAWRDVLAKAQRIRSEGGVRVTYAGRDMIVGEVKGDHHVYETGIQHMPGGPAAIGSWACGCKWAAYRQAVLQKSAGDAAPSEESFGWWSFPEPRTAARRSSLTGRPCSHVMALHLEAQSRGHARALGPAGGQDTRKPKWVPRKVVVKWDIDEQRNEFAKSSTRSPADQPYMPGPADEQMGEHLYQRHGMDPENLPYGDARHWQHWHDAEHHYLTRNDHQHAVPLGHPLEEEYPAAHVVPDNASDVMGISGGRSTRSWEADVPTTGPFIPDSPHYSARRAPLSWDEIGERHPDIYGDPEVHGEHVRGDGEGIGWAANHLANDRPEDPGAENSGSWDLSFHQEHVPVSSIDYARTDRYDDRVRHAQEGYNDRDGQYPGGGDLRPEPRDPTEGVPPLVLVHRHGVYQVADGHHRAQGAHQAGRRKVRAYVHYSEHPDTPFSENEDEDQRFAPFHGARPHPGVAAHRDFFKSAAANDPFGGSNTMVEVPTKPYGATSPPNKWESPASAGSLAAADPEGWGSIQEWSGAATSSPHTGAMADDISPERWAQLPRTHRDAIMATDTRDALHEDAAGRGHDMQWSHGTGWGQKGRAQYWSGQCRNCGAGMHAGATSTTSVSGRDAREGQCAGPGTSWQNDMIEELQHKRFGDAFTDYQHQLKNIDDRGWLRDQSIEAALRQGVILQPPAQGDDGQPHNPDEGIHEGHAGGPYDQMAPADPNGMSATSALRALWAIDVGTMDDGSNGASDPVDTAGMSDTAGMPGPPPDGAQADLHHRPEPALPSTDGSRLITGAAEDPYRGDDLEEHLRDFHSWKPGDSDRVRASGTDVAEYHRLMHHSPPEAFRHPHSHMGMSEDDQAALREMGVQASLIEAFWRFADMSPGDQGDSMDSTPASGQPVGLNTSNPAVNAADPEPIAQTSGTTPGLAGPGLAPSTSQLPPTTAYAQPPQLPDNSQGYPGGEFGGPGTGQDDESLSPDDASIQTIGAVQESGGNDEIDDLNPSDLLGDETSGTGQQISLGSLRSTEASVASDGDIAAAARMHLQKIAMDTFSDAEARELIGEGRGKRALNLDRLDLEGTHFADLERKLAESGLDPDDDIVLI